MPRHDAMAIVVVTHESAAHLGALATALLSQLREEDELLIVDNLSLDGTPAVAREIGGPVRVLETGLNLGFAAGCNEGAAATEAPLLLFLNPDSRPHERCLDELRRAAGDHPDWGAWQAAVMLEDGRINSSGGVIHYLGIGWAGDCGRPASALPAADSEVAFPSGAAMVVRRADWDALGGLDADYFMYGEDLDLGLRLWLRRRRVGIVPTAQVTHDYEFEKGPAKWFWLERNRWLTVLSVYPAALLVMLAPALLAAELALLAIAARQGWLRSKLRAQLAVLRHPGLIRSRRRRVQASRLAGASELASCLRSELDSPYLGEIGESWAATLQAAYFRAVRALLGA